MEKSVFGKIITRYRERYDLPQSAICKGICSNATYLRAEIEERAVDFVMQEALLARVGQDATNFEVILDDDEFFLWTERLAVRSALAGKQFEVIREKVEVYRRESAGKNKLHEQFCLYYEMKLAQWCGEDEASICQLAARALALTKQIEEMPEIKSNLFTPVELDLLLTLVQYQYREWSDWWKRKDCLRRIIEYVDTYFNKERQEDIEAKAWMELLKLEEKFGDAEALLTYIERAIKCFVGGSSILQLAEVRFMKAKLLLKISRSSEDEEIKRELCREECEMAFCIYEVMEREEERLEVERFCEEELQWPITMQMK